MCFHIRLFSYASRPKDNKNVDKQKNNADLNEIEPYFSRRIKLGVRFEKRLKSVPYGKIFTFKRLNYIHFYKAWDSKINVYIQMTLVVNLEYCNLQIIQDN